MCVCVCVCASVCVCVRLQVCVCVYNPVIQGRTFFHVSMFTCLQAGGRGTHTDSSANKAGLYVVRISLGTLSDVPAEIQHVRVIAAVHE